MKNTIYAGVRNQHLVVDNLNTHFASSFKAVLDAEGAGPILARLDFHHMPKHASWLRSLFVAVLTLVANAANAASGGVAIDVNRLWMFQAELAAGFRGAVPVVDSAVDSAVPTPGLVLALSRRCYSNLGARMFTGWFGLGWHTAWEARLLIGGSGVTLVGEGGSMRLFTFDVRTGGYFSPVGESRTMIALGSGVYELRDPNGGAVRFRSEVGSDGRSYGRVDYVQDPNGNRVSATYDDTGRLITLSHTAGGFISIAYNGAGHNGAGLVQSVTNSAGRFATYAYDGNLLQTVTTDDGKVTSYTYETGHFRELHSVTRGGVTRQFTYDGVGRVTSTFLAAGEQLLQFGYDGASSFSITDGQGTNWLFFDDRGLLARIVDPLGNITTAEHDNDLRLSRLLLPTGESRSYSWCGCGSPTSLTDELGQTTRFSYDHPRKRLTSFTDARANTTRYTYDAQGNKLSATYPDGSASYKGNYSASGLAQSSTNRRSQPIAYAYTSSGQLSRRTFADGSYAQFDYDARGNLTNIIEHPVSGPDKITAFLYAYATDGDRLRKVTYPNSRWVEFFYDSFGRRQRVTDSAGGDTRYEYDPAGRLWKLRDTVNAVLVEYLYNAAGRLQRVNKGNGTYTSFDYDPAGQLLHLTNSAPDGSVNSRFDYTYDRRGRRTAMQTVDGNWSYDYDGSEQLTRAVFASSNPGIPSQDLQYSYDADGNRVSAVSNGVATAYVANNLNQYTSVGGIACQYDADGNLISDGAHSYAYDVQNRLVRVTGPEGATDYEYDTLGNRTATVFNGQRTEYLVDPTGLPSVLAEHDGAGSVLVRHVFGQGLVASAPGGGTLSYFDFDALGSTVGITSNNAAVANRYAYLPFGERLFSVESFANRFGFVGQYGVMSEANGLNFMRARFYDSRQGRFTSGDPAGIAVGHNLYAYAGNEPLRRIDPVGLEWRVELCVKIFELFYAFWGGAVGGALGEETKVPFVAAILAAFGASQGAGFGFVVGHEICEERVLGGEEGEDGPGRPGDRPRLPGEGALGDPFRIAGFSLPPWNPSPDPDPDGGGLGDFGLAVVQVSRDPNQKLGPNGIGASHHVLPGAVLPYRIDFENEASASAPAQEVVITDQLSTNLDLATFQLTDLGFGDQMIFVPTKLQHYETTVTMACCGNIFQVQVEAGLKLESGQVYAVFRSIDPATSLPPAVQYGFLPPEDGTGRGQGHLSYLIQARTNLPTGAEIRNTALIVFDRQNAIATNQRDPHNPAAGTDPAKEALNTIDAGPPTSVVLPLPAESGRSFMVQWTGQDDAGGAGIANYDVFVSRDGAPFVRWLQGANVTSAPFIGADPGHRYAFYSIARDLFGHEELAPLAADAQTTVVTNAPLLAGITNRVIGAGESLTISNMVQGTPVGSFIFSLDPGAPFGAGVNPTNGLLNWTPTCSQASTTNSVTVWVTDSGRTNISDAASFTVVVRECVSPQLGQLVLRAGGTGKLPVNLVSSVPLTNLATWVSAPVERLVNLGVESIVPQICTNSIATITNSLYLLTLATCSNQFLIGTQQVAWLNVTAVTNQHSGFVPVEIGPSIGTQPDGAFVTNFVTQAGRVVVVGEEPLLETSRSTNGQVQLLLYAPAGTTNVIETTGRLPAEGLWLPWQQVATTNLWLSVPLTATNNALFIRAMRR